MKGRKSALSRVHSLCWENYSIIEGTFSGGVILLTKYQTNYQMVGCLIARTFNTYSVCEAEDVIRYLYEKHSTEHLRS